MSGFCAVLLIFFKLNFSFFFPTFDVATIIMIIYTCQVDLLLSSKKIIVFSLCHHYLQFSFLMIFKILFT